VVSCHAGRRGTLRPPEHRATLAATLGEGQDAAGATTPACTEQTPAAWNKPAGSAALCPRAVRWDISSALAPWRSDGLHFRASPPTFFVFDLLFLACFRALDVADYPLLQMASAARQRPVLDGARAAGVTPALRRGPFSSNRTSNIPAYTTLHTTHLHDASAPCHAYRRATNNPWDGDYNSYRIYTTLPTHLAVTKQVVP